MTFDPIRREELRIMGFSDVVHDGTDPRERMGKQLTVDGPHDVTDGRVEAQMGDYLIEYDDKQTEVVPGMIFAAANVLMPPEPTEVDETPVELAEPVGLLQRDDSADEEAAS